MMTNDEFRRFFFDCYAADDDGFDDEWFEAFFENAYSNGDPAWIDIDWDNETNSGNFASGDEEEMLYLFSDEGFVAYWTRSTFNGLQGPFETYDEAVVALGYDPASFPSDPPESDEDDLEDTDE